MLARQSKKSGGFTTIELLLVAVVVIILAGLIAVNFRSVREHNRDSQRKQDIIKLQAQVEVYEAETGQYPTLVNLNNSSFRSAHFKDFDTNILKDPSGKNDTLVSTPQPHAYAYQPSPAGCNNSGSNICTGYTLTASLEQGGTYIKSSP